MDARVIFSKKTKEEMSKDLGRLREKGRIRFARLEELDNDGTLSKAKSRADVARLVGYSEERAKSGYAWISSLIYHGHLTEKILSWSPSGRAECEYHITGTKPNYYYEEVYRRETKKKVGQELQRRQDKVVARQISQAPEPQLYDEKQVASDTKITTPIRIEITRGDTTIKIEMNSHEEAGKLITTILKGE